MSLQKRREFLQFIGKTGLGLSIISLLDGCTHIDTTSKLPFIPLTPSDKDDFILADGFNYKIIAKAEDKIGDNLFFGYHNDFTAFTPFKGKTDEGILWVNHEYTHPVLLHMKKKSQLTRSKQEIIDEQKTVGGSLIHIKKTADSWRLVENSSYNRRLDALTKIPFTGDQKILGSREAIGTLANCAGGVTPWGTVLSSEENYHIFYGDVTYKNHQRTFVEGVDMNWYTQFPFPPEHYGWVVEVDPFAGSAKKHVSLGRAAHEGATPVYTKNKNKIVVYMGEDRAFGYIFKFVSESPNNFDKGILYAADTKNGKWLPLDLNLNKDLRKHFNSQLDVLIYSRFAAEYAGATPQDRPEDIEIDPSTGDILISLTNNKDNANHFGGLLRIKEQADYDSESFSSSVFIAGGETSGFSCPDNMAFDKKGNLWLTVDMSEKDMNQGQFKSFKNNGLFYIPLSGPHSGRAFQVASAPTDAELTGPSFSPDGKTLFLSVQHPGGSTQDPKHPTSHWPLGKDSKPLSCVICIQGETLNRIG